MRIYVDYREISDVPELADVCKADNSFVAFMEWLAANRPHNLSFDVIVSVESPHVDDGTVQEVWVPKAPHMRAQQIGGILKSFIQKE